MGSLIQKHTGQRRSPRGSSRLSVTLPQQTQGMRRRLQASSAKGIDSREVDVSERLHPATLAVVVPGNATWHKTGQLRNESVEVLERDIDPLVLRRRTWFGPWRTRTWTPRSTNAPKNWFQKSVWSLRWQMMQQ